MCHRIFFYKTKKHVWRPLVFTFLVFFLRVIRSLCEKCAFTFPRASVHVQCVVWWACEVRVRGAAGVVRVCVFVCLCVYFVWLTNVFSFFFLNIPRTVNPQGHAGVLVYRTVFLFSFPYTSEFVLPSFFKQKFRGSIRGPQGQKEGNLMPWRFCFRKCLGFAASILAWVCCSQFIPVSFQVSFRKRDLKLKHKRDQTSSRMFFCIFTLTTPSSLGS